MSHEDILESINQVDEPVALWSVLDQRADAGDFYHFWLQMQCESLPKVEQGVLIVKHDDRDAYVPVAKWPIKADASRLAEVAEQVLVEKCGLLSALEDGSGHLAVAYPAFVNDELYGVVCLELSSQNQQYTNQAMSQLQWSVGWIEGLKNRSKVQEQHHQLEGMRSSIRLLAVVQSEINFTSASMALVTELATQLHSTRVSIGFPRGKHVHVEALSHSSQFGKRMNLIRAIATAMEEAIIFGREIRYPPVATNDLTFADHRSLAKQFSADAILTLPVYANNKYYCAITLERDEGKVFSDEDVEYCRSIAVLTAPSLEEKRLNDRPIWVKIKEAVTRQVNRLIGPHYIGRKVTAAVLFLLIVFFSFATGDYKVSADSVMEGEIQRVIAAPFSGYIAEVGPRAGELLDKGELICTLDDKDIRLERLSYLSELGQYQKEYQDALAKHDRAQTNILKAQIEQTDAILELVESKLNRTRVVAPFAGILISGDLSQRQGAYVEQGEELFKLAPLDSYRIILNVNEQQIADVQSGQQGELVLASLPNEKFRFDVTMITPETQAKDGLNTFRVEAHLKDKSDLLRPGMKGVGKIYVEERRLISIWTRSLTVWLRLWIWSWLP